jgi:hypothetical protein
VLGDRVFVSEEFAGRVIEVGGTDQRVLSAFGWVLSIVAGIGTTLLVGGALLAIQQRYQREENLA